MKWLIVINHCTTLFCLISALSSAAVCPTDYYQCDDNTCIPAVSVCDGEAQCDDGSDEWNCSKNQFYFTISESVF